MKTLARILCFSVFVLVPVARIGAGDDEQIPSLFEQVRMAIPKLKSGMTYHEVERLLMLNKLAQPRGGEINFCGIYHYDIEGKPGQLLTLVFFRNPKSEIALIHSAELSRGDKIVAQFDADKK